MFLALGIFLPVTFAVGIAARKHAPTVTELPSSLVATSETFKSVAWERADLFAKSPVQVRLLREKTNSGRFAVAFSAPKAFAQPDLIVYWVAGNPNLADSLPDRAILLGTFSAAALPLRDEIAKTSGVIILYSLANGEIVDALKPILVNDSTK